MKFCATDYFLTLKVHLIYMHYYVIEVNRIYLYIHISIESLFHHLIYEYHEWLQRWQKVNHFLSSQIKQKMKSEHLSRNKAHKDMKDFEKRDPK